MRQRLADAEADAAALRAAISVLEPDGGAATPQPASRRGARASDDGQTRAVVSLTSLMRMVAEHPGQTNSWLVKHTGGEQSQLLGMLKQAEADGRVRRSGQRRGTRWWITDADASAS